MIKHIVVAVALVSGCCSFITADSFDEAETFLKQSPFFQNDLYERVEVAEFSPEVGDLG